MVDILHDLEEKDKRFHTKPFLSGEWGSVNCYHVPFGKALELVRAFETLSGSYPAIRVRGMYYDEQKERVWLPTLTTVNVVQWRVIGWATVQLARGVVTIYPEHGEWEEIELSSVQ